jgi:hypothetical protein
MTYIKDTTEEYEAGETGRTMLKVHNEEGETMLIDKGKNKIIDTVSVDVQTHDIQTYKMEVVEKPQIEVAKPVAAALAIKVAHVSDGDDSLEDEKEVGEDEENELFGKIETNEPGAKPLDKDLGVIDEAENES